MRQGTLRTVDELLEEVGTYASFLKRAKGGLTISGGEPLMQPEFTQALFQGAKEMGLHTVLDSSGALHDRVPDPFFDAIDLVLLDIKAGDEETHRMITKKPLQPTLDFADRLTRLKKPMWMRFVLVPGLNDHPDHIRKVAHHIAKYPTVERVEILAFHQMASFKYEQLGIEYTLKDNPEATPRDVVEAWNIFSEEGVYNHAI
jgi:pyruvate formate lyase activating enzyme